MNRAKTLNLLTFLGLLFTTGQQGANAANVDFHGVVTSHQNTGKIPYLEVFTFTDQVAVQYPVSNNSAVARTVALEVNDKSGALLPARISPGKFNLAPGQTGSFFIILDMQDQGRREFQVCQTNPAKSGRRNCVGYISSRVH